MFANILLIFVVHNFYTQHEYSNYTCGVYTHVFGFVLPLLVVAFLWLSPKVTSAPLICLKALVYVLAYSMFWFHFMYDLESREVL